MSVTNRLIERSQKLKLYRVSRTDGCRQSRMGMAGCWDGGGEAGEDLLIHLQLHFNLQHPILQVSPRMYFNLSVSS